MEVLSIMTFTFLLLGLCQGGLQTADSFLNVAGLLALLTGLQLLNFLLEDFLLLDHLLLGGGLLLLHLLYPGLQVDFVLPGTALHHGHLLLQAVDLLPELLLGRRHPGDLQLETLYRGVPGGELLLGRLFDDI